MSILNQSNELLPPEGFHAPPGLYKALDLHRRDFNDLFKSDPGKMVVYYNGERIAIRETKSELYECCRRRGYDPLDLVIKWIDPSVVD